MLFHYHINVKVLLSRIRGNSFLYRSRFFHPWAPWAGGSQAVLHVSNSNFFFNWQNLNLASLLPQFPRERDGCVQKCKSWQLQR